jgi:hypothetical protein
MGPAIQTAELPIAPPSGSTRPVNDATKKACDWHS